MLVGLQSGSIRLAGKLFQAGTNSQVLSEVTAEAEVTVGVVMFCRK